MVSRGSGACPSCGTATPAGARFCPACGQRLEQSAAFLEERKTVTTLFCDLVGFTAMSELADPEDVDACLRSFGAVAREVIERYGGTVEKFIGDAVVGVFGVPVVHEDDPERAVRAALRLIKGIGDLERPDGTPLAARAGVMTGELLVVHGADPASGKRFLAGDAVSTAARLEASAAPGAVIVGELTHRLTEHAIVYRELQSASAKGKARPLQRWVARRPIARSEEDALGDRLSPLVGRDGDLAFLISLLRKAIDGAATQIALILGDPGIGKTRLVRELFTFVDASPELVTWRQGRCVPYGEGRTFWALREIVRAHAGILRTHDAETTAELLERVVPAGPDHRWMCDRLRPLVGLDAPESDPEENYAAWLRFFREVASQRPFVLVIEDLHFADDAMLDFVDYAFGRLDGLPLLLIGTARPEILEQRPALAASRSRATRMWLDRLSDEETRRLVGLLPEMSGRAGATIDLVAHRAEGNPFFAEELARLLAQSPGGADRAAALPQSVQAVIAARIDALSREAKATLTNAAVVGGVFWRGALRASAGQAAADVKESLAELVDRQLVRRVKEPSLEGEEEYAFCHGMVRDVAYSELPRGARAARHAAFAGWLEAKVGDRARGDLSDVLADHYAAAAELAQAVGDGRLKAAATDTAVDYLAVSGDRAMGLDAGAAARRYARALDLLGSAHRRRPALLSRFAEALFQQGRYRDAAAALLQAAAGFGVAGDHRQAALAAARRADVLYALGDPGVTLQLQGALALLKGQPPCPEMVTVLGKIGKALWLGGDPGAGLGRLQEAIEMAARLGIPEPVLFLGYRGGIRCIMGDVGGLDDYERALRVAGERERLDEASLLTFNYADALLSYRGPVAAAEALGRGLEAVRQRRRKAREATTVTAGAHPAGPSGEWDAETARRLNVNLVESLGMMGEWDARAGDGGRAGP